MDSIKNDQNMIIEEGGFWDMLSTKYQTMIIKELFSDVKLVLKPLIGGCESGFINNFIISFSYRSIYAGMRIAQIDLEADLFIVWKGAVAVCEQSEFEEPIVVYQKGTPVNLYQIMMEADLPFNYRAIDPDEYSWTSGASKVIFNEMHDLRKLKIAFNEHRYKPWDFPQTAKEITLYAVEKDRLEELFETYPFAEEIFESYCLQQVNFLKQTRLKA